MKNRPPALPNRQDLGHADAMLIRLLRTALAVIALSALGDGAAFAACKLGKFVEFPITMAGTRPLTTIKINGQDATFMVDSGAFYSTLSAAAAAQYKLPLAPAPFNLRVRGVGGEVRDLYYATAKSMTIANVNVPKVDFLVQENDFGAGTVGLMGQNIIGVRDTEFDLGNGAVRLFERKDCDKANLAYWDPSHSASSVPIIRHETPSMLASLTQSAVTYAYVNGVKIEVTWDTGAGNSLMTLDAAKRAGINLADPSVKAIGGAHGVGGRLVKSWIAPVASFKVGDEEIKNTRLLIADFHLESTDMLLGADFFLSHRVYVANGLNRLYFTYSGGPVFKLEDPPAGQTAATPTSPQGEEPKDADGYSRRGVAFAGRKDFAHALSDLDQAVSLAPSEARYYFERATVHLQNRQQFLAMADLDKALALKPDDLAALVTRAELKLAGKDKAGAQIDADAAAGRAPRESNARKALGDIYERLGLYAPAVAQYDLWLQFHGDDVLRAPALNGRCYSKAVLNQDLDRALGDCNAALRLMPNTAAFLDSRALVQLRRGDLDRAIADYDAALKLQPRLALALYGRGLAKTRKGLAADGQADIAAASALAADIREIAKARGLTP